MRVRKVVSDARIELWGYDGGLHETLDGARSGVEGPGRVDQRG